MSTSEKLMVILIFAIGLVLLYLIFSDIYFSGRREIEFEVFKDLNMERNNILVATLSEHRELSNWVKTPIPKAPRISKAKIETPIKFADSLPELNKKLNTFAKKV